MKRTFNFAVLFLMLYAFAHARPWDYPLYLDGGTPAAKRVKLEIENKTDSDFEAYPIKVAAKTLGISGQNKASIRVVSENGKELLFAVFPDTQRLNKKSCLVIPADCPAKSKASVWVYFDNPDAIEPPDSYYLFNKSENFDSENGESFPLGWTYRNGKNIPADALSQKYAKSGRKSLRTVRDDLSPYSYKLPLRIDTPESASRRMYPKADMLTEGNAIKVSAYVRTDSVEAGEGGGVGIALIFNFKDGKFKVVRSGKMLTGTSDWQKLTLVAEVPKGATGAAFSTVADIKSGEGYFDNVKILRDSQTEKYSLKAHRTEKLKLSKDSAEKDWEAPKDKFNLRAPASFFNLTGEATGDAIGIVPINIVSRGNFRPSDFKVYKNGREIPSALLNKDIIFPLDPIAPNTETQYNIYISENRKNRAAKVAASKQASYILSDLVSDVKNRDDSSGFEAILNSKANLIKNPSFESGMDQDWALRMSKAENSGEIAVVDGGLFGKRALRIKFNEHIKDEATGGFKFPAGASSGKKKAHRPKLPNDYFGLRQEIKVKPNKTYAGIAWVKSCGEPRDIGLPRFLIINGGNTSYRNSAVFSSGDWVASSRFLTSKDGDRIWVDALIGGKGNVMIDGMFAGESIRASKFRYESLADSGPEYFAAWQVSPIIKVFKFFSPPSVQKIPAISLAKNEYENLQLAVRTNGKKRRLEISAPAPKLKGAGGETGAGKTGLGAPKVSVALNIVCDAPSAYQIFNGVKYNERCIPRNSMIEEYPDPLVSQNHIDLDSKSTESVWLTFHADENTADGEYEGSVSFTDGGETVASIPYTVTVRKFAIPQKAGLTAIFDARGGGFNGGWRAEVKAPGITSKFYDLMQLQEFMAKYRTTVDMPPKIKFFMRDGKLAADFSEFDAFCEESFGKLGVKMMYLPQISSFAFANRFSRIYRDDNSLKKPIAPYEGSFPYPGADLKKFRPEYTAELKARVKLIYDHLDKKGWRDNFLWYVCDEPHCDVDGIADMVKAYCSLVKSVEPKAMLYSSTWAYTPMLAGGINTWGIDMSSERTPSDIAEINKRGEKKLFTTDGNYCINTPYCAQERIMSIFCYAGGFEGYEYWGVDWYTRNPFKWGMHYDRISFPAPDVRNRTRYPNGDGYFLYSGEIIGRNEIFPSIRFESVRDGQEDYEYYTMLEKLATKSGDKAALETLEKVKSLAVYPNARGTRSVELLPNPEVVEKLREEVAGHIERLSE